MDAMRIFSIPTQFSWVNFGGLGNFRYMFPLNGRGWGNFKPEPSRKAPWGQHPEESQQRACLLQFAAH